MTAEDWKEVETRLSIPYSSVKLKIDGYDVTIGHAMEKPLKYCLAIYIDGIFKTKWVLEDCEIRRRFCSKHTKSLLTAKEKKALDRERKAFREEVLKKSTYDWYSPYWNSFRRLKAHLIKNNKSIEIGEDAYEVD